MALDNIAMIEAESARLVAALDANPTARIPWSDEWTVAVCALHVGGTHHVVSQIIRDRPTASFSLFKSLERPHTDDPGLGRWIAEGTAELVAQLRATEPSAECWSWWAEGHTAAFWQRRMAQETLVHRWDAELGAGVAIEPMAPEAAADGIDEHFEIFAALTRLLNSAPAGPSVHLHCTDTEGEWLVTLPEAGATAVTREHAKGDIALRGPAEGLLLFAWGRLTPAEAGLDVVGDASIVDRWTELFPSM